MKSTEYEKATQILKVTMNGVNFGFNFFTKPNTIRVISVIPMLTIKGLKSKVKIKTTINPRPNSNHRKFKPSRINTKKSPKNTIADPASG